LIEASDYLYLNEIFNDLGDYLIKEHKNWIRENLAYVYIISQRSSFTFTQNYCNELIRREPALIFKSVDFITLDKPMLLSFLKKDDLDLEEIEIWDYIVEWGIAQDNEKDFYKWNNDNFNNLKLLLDDIIPLIRFKEISYDDFNKKIDPLKMIMNEDLYNEILEYHLAIDTWKPKLMLQKGSRSKSLLNLESKCLVSSWIDNQENNIYDKNNIPYEFKLLLREPRDNISKSIFNKKCGNIEKIIIIMKIKETGELVGGYNPVGWNIKGKSPTEEHWIETNKSFIFKIDEIQMKDSILSRVRMPSEALYIGGNQKPNHLIDFGDFYLKQKPEDEIYFRNQSYKNIYEKDLCLEKKFDISLLALDEIEIYQILNK
jgi:hypothetical protein